MRIHNHTRAIPENTLPKKPEPKLTKQPAGKWIELGHHHVIPDINGKILGMVYGGEPGKLLAPVSAYAGSRDLGKYISHETARRAVDKALGKNVKEQDELLDTLIARFQKLRDAADETPNTTV